MPASSQASSELSTASLTVVSRALRGIVEAQQVAVLGEELADRDVALPGGHRLGRGPAPGLLAVVGRGIGLAFRLAVTRRNRARRGGHVTNGLLFAFHHGQRLVLLDPRGFRSGDRGGPTQGAEPAAARIGLWVREDGFQRFGL